MNTPLNEVRRKARLLENEIDSKLIQLNKVNSTQNGSLPNGNIADRYSSSGISGDSKRTLFDRLSMDIEGLIFKLTKLNNEMKDLLENDKSDPNSKPALYHTVRRHRDILRDYSIEFGRASTNIRSQLEREDLLGSANSPTISNNIESTPSLNNRSKMSDTYIMRESDRINSCDRLLDEQISIVMSVKENVNGQGSHLGGINRRLHQITKKYPAINSVMQKIRFKKRKDTVILATVITTCLIIFFLYAMR